MNWLITKRHIYKTSLYTAQKLAMLTASIHVALLRISQLTFLLQLG